mgnify:CR=1 FL=1
MCDDFKCRLMFFNSHKRLTTGGANVVVILIFITQLRTQNNEFREDVLASNFFCSSIFGHAENKLKFNGKQ